jgi:hypothetical protein
MKTVSPEFLSRPREIMLSRPFLSLHSLPNLPTQQNPRPADLLTSRFADWMPVSNSAWVTTEMKTSASGGRDFKC